MHKLAIVSIIVALAGCKSTNKNDGSSAKELQVMDTANGSFDVIFATGQTQGPAAKGDASLSTTALSVQKGSEEVAATTGFCWQRCKTGTPPEGSDASASDISCELLGHAKNKEFIDAGAKTSPAAQQLIHDIIAKDVRKVSAEEPGVSAAFAELTANFTRTEETENFCRPKEGGQGLQLASYYHTALYINNTSSRTLTVNVNALILANTNLFEQRNGAVFTIAPNTNTRLSIDGGNVFGSYSADVYVGKTFIGSASGKFTSPQANGAHTLNVTANDVAKAGGGSSGGGGGSAATDVASCTAAIRLVYDHYPDSYFVANTNRTSEVQACWGAADASGAGWSKLMKVYYCEHPGRPVRECFTTSAGVLRKAGYDRKVAYTAAYSVCLGNGSFSTFTSTMQGNFKEIMINGWSSSNDNRCISDFGRNP